MRCCTCDRLLTTKESCTKFKTGGYTDMCTPCLQSIDAEVVVPQRFLAETFADEQYDVEEWEEPKFSDEVAEDDND